MVFDYDRRNFCNDNFDYGVAMTEITLKKIKTTPGTVVYGEVSSAGDILPKEYSRIPSLYIKKQTFEGALPPAKVKVLIED